MLSGSFLPTAFCWYAIVFLEIFVKSMIFQTDWLFVVFHSFTFSVSNKNHWNATSIIQQCSFLFGNMIAFLTNYNNDKIHYSFENMFGLLALESFWNTELLLIINFRDTSLLNTQNSFIKTLYKEFHIRKFLFCSRSVYDFILNNKRLRFNSWVISS